MNSQKRNANDTELQSGYGVFVEEKEFRSVIAKYPNEQEVMIAFICDVTFSWILRTIQLVAQTFMPLQTHRSDLPSLEGALPELSVSNAPDTHLLCELGTFTRASGKLIDMHVTS
jgi:hypothetical protein